MYEFLHRAQVCRVVARRGGAPSLLAGPLSRKGKHADEERPLIGKTLSLVILRSSGSALFVFFCFVIGHKPGLAL